MIPALRIGTSGSLQKDIPVDGFVFSKFGLGLDGLLNFYKLTNDDEEKEIPVGSYIRWRYRDVNNSKESEKQLPELFEEVASPKSRVGSRD